MNLLVIGYSGLDKEDLRLFTESGSQLKSLLVANGSEEMSARAAEKIAEAFGARMLFKEESIFPAGFTELVEAGRHREFIQAVAGR